MDLGAIAQIYLAVTQHAAGMAPRLIDAGVALMQGLMVIMIVWRLLPLLLDADPPNTVMAEMIRLGLLAGIGYYSITGIADTGLRIIEGFDWIATKLTGEQAGADALSAGMAQILHIGQNLINSYQWPKPSGITEFVTQIPAYLVASMFKVVTILAVLFTGALMGGYFIVSQILAGIALALGPVMLPFYLVPALEFIANGWLRFLIAACMYRLIGVVMLSFINAMTGTLAAVAQAAGQSTPGMANTIDLVGAAVILFVAVVVAMLVMQIPTIANGIVSGSALGGLTFKRPAQPGRPQKQNQLPAGGKK